MRTDLYDVSQRIAIMNDLFRYRALMDVTRWLETRKAKLMKQTLRSVGPPAIEELTPSDHMDLSQERFVARLIYALLLIMGFTVVVLLDTPFGRGELPQYNYVWGTFLLSIVFYIVTVTVGPGVILPPSLSPPSSRNSPLNTNMRPSTVSCPLTTQLCFAWFAHVDCLTRDPPTDFFLPGVLDATSFSSFPAGASKNNDCCDPSPLVALTVRVPQIPTHERWLSRPILPAECAAPPTTTAASETTFVPPPVTACNTSPSATVTPSPSSLASAPSPSSLSSSGRHPFPLCPPPSSAFPSAARLPPSPASPLSPAASTSPPVALLSSLSLLCPSLPLPLLRHLAHRIHTLLSSCSSSPSPSLSPPSHPSLPPLTATLLSPAFCLACMHTRPHRAKHCRQCGACIARHDHHCPFLATCVGAGNHVYFALFLFLTVATLLTALILNYHAMPTLPCVYTLSLYFITVTVPSFAQDAHCTRAPSSPSLSSSSLSTPVLLPEAMWSLLFFFQCIFLVLAALLLPLAATHAAMLLADATTHQLLGKDTELGESGQAEKGKRRGDSRDEMAVSVGVSVGVGNGDGDVDIDESDVEAGSGNHTHVHVPLLRQGGTRVRALLLPQVWDAKDRKDEAEDKTGEDVGKNSKIFGKTACVACFPGKKCREGACSPLVVCGHAVSVMRNVYDAGTCYRHRRELWVPVPIPVPVASASTSNSTPVPKSESGSLRRFGGDCNRAGVGDHNTAPDGNASGGGECDSSGVCDGLVDRYDGDGEDRSVVDTNCGVVDEDRTVVQEFWQLVEWSIHNKDAVQC